MADQHRASTDSLKKLLAFQAKPYRYGFFSAVRMLDNAFPNQPRTGTSARPSDEAVRIGQEPTLKFAPSTIASFYQRESDQTWHLQSYFFGLFGPNGALPTHLTDFAQLRIKHHRDATFARFVDLFHHRLACFFYRAWAASQPTVHMDRPESDRFATYVASLCGFGFDSLRNRDAMPDDAKLYFCSHMASSTRHSAGLKSILQKFYGVSVDIVPFVSHWIVLPDDCLWKLGAKQTVAGEESGGLGVSITLGARVRDCQQRFQINVGPMNLTTFRQLLPRGASMQRLKAIVDEYVGYELSWVVQLILNKDEVPRLTLGRQSHLGWTTWLASRSPAAHARELIIDPSKNSRPPTASRSVESPPRKPATTK